jgi:hypothetical protein
MKQPEADGTANSQLGPKQETTTKARISRHLRLSPPKLVFIERLVGGEAQKQFGETQAQEAQMAHSERQTSESP